MERTVTVLYEGALAYFNVAQKKDGNLIARLLKYNGDPKSSPPAEFHLHKEGRHWVDNNKAADLADEIGYAIELQKRNLKEPVYDWRSSARANGK